MPPPPPFPPHRARFSPSKTIPPPRETISSRGKIIPSRGKMPLKRGKLRLSSEKPGKTRAKMPHRPANRISRPTPTPQSRLEAPPECARPGRSSAWGKSGTSKTPPPARHERARRAALHIQSHPPEGCDRKWRALAVGQASSLTVHGASVPRVHEHSPAVWNRRQEAAGTVRLEA